MDATYYLHCFEVFQYNRGYMDAQYGIVMIEPNCPYYKRGYDCGKPSNDS